MIAGGRLAFVNNGQLVSPLVPGTYKHAARSLYRSIDRRRIDMTENQRVELRPEFM